MLMPKINTATLPFWRPVNTARFIMFGAYWCITRLIWIASLTLTGWQPSCGQVSRVILEVVSELLKDHRTDVHARDDRGYTALFLWLASKTTYLWSENFWNAKRISLTKANASFSQQFCLDTSILFAWDKIDVNAKNELGRTVFDLARIHKKFDVAHYLEKRIEECSKNATMKTLRSCYRAASLVERWQIGRTHFLVILIDSMNS